MDSIIFSLSKVPDAITDKTVYTAHVQTNGTLGRDELAERLAARTKQDVSLWKYFLDALSDEIGIQLLAGYRINLGQLTTGFAIRGAFMSEDEAFDPAKHQLIATVRTLDPLRSAMSAVSPENVTLGLTCSVAAVMDAVTKRLSEITGTNRVLIQGQKLGISPDNPDEGVWLVNAKTGEPVATATVERSDSQTIDCVFAEPPEPGTYTLVVSCRNGMRESLKPATAKVKNIVVKAA
ncbi:MAG: DUF4469 domain-containing protein [Kiritimatiellae bacterium]|nr:DUF4469 domain-containing protein [Kiritimatiellia bacterium]